MAQPNRCPQCGRSLEDALKSSNGLAVCPQCAHSVASAESLDRTTQIHLPEEMLQSVGSDRFRLAGTLGEGGFGTVYRAFDTSLRRHVAIKVPKRGALEFDARQFILEARAASGLRHPHVVTIFDVGFFEEEPYIVSDCIDGVSLRQWLDGPAANFENIARVAEKICRAIGYAHAKGVVHRDIKPSNIIVDDAGEPHVFDFGLASSRATGDAVKLRPDVPVGTPAFMSPEQVLGKVERVGQASDVYALGVVLYQMLTRRLPFVGSPSRIFEMVLHDEPVRPRKIDARIPAPLEAIALKAMAKGIGDRYASADSMADDLRRYLDGQPVRALGRHDKRSLLMTARRRFMAGTASVLGIGLLGTAGWAGYRAYRDDARVWVRLNGNSGSERVAWVPFDEYGGGARLEDAVVGYGDDWFKLAPGLFKVYVWDGSYSAEVFRTVPSNDVITYFSSGIPELKKADVRCMFASNAGDRRGVYILPNVELKTPKQLGMVSVGGGSISYSGPAKPLLGDHKIAPFEMDPREATVQDIVSEFGSPIYNGDAARTSSAVLPFPVALEFAERRGVAVTSIWEWLFAATNGGRTAYPWGDEIPSGLAWKDLEAIDRAVDAPELQQLYSGFGEWTETPVKLPDATRQRQNLAASSIRPSRAVVGVRPDAFNPSRVFSAERLRDFDFRDLTNRREMHAVRCVHRQNLDIRSRFS